MSHEEEEEEPRHCHEKGQQREGDSLVVVDQTKRERTDTERKWKRTRPLGRDSAHMFHWTSEFLARAASTSRWTESATTVQQRRRMCCTGEEEGARMAWCKVKGHWKEENMWWPRNWRT